MAFPQQNETPAAADTVGGVSGPICRLGEGTERAPPVRAHLGSGFARGIGRPPLVHVGEPLHRFGETGDCRIGVPMLNAIADAVLDMAFQHNLPAPVER